MRWGLDVNHHTCNFDRPAPPTQTRTSDCQRIRFSSRMHRGEANCGVTTVEGNRDFSPTDSPAKANYFNYLSAIDFATART